ncbi:MAG: hypothetical protein HeimC3_22400 [Candidatus Heimdallarchaeota archaeon LC_3]|nr:MAG: hypothetical protein HeimC3_22400 [Candidatus Heimdallarchaeota archaeon LC_3]
MEKEHIWKVIIDIDSISDVELRKKIEYLNHDNIRKVAKIYGITFSEKNYGISSFYLENLNYSTGSLNVPLSGLVDYSIFKKGKFESKGGAVVNKYFNIDLDEEVQAKISFSELKKYDFITEDKKILQKAEHLSRRVKIINTNVMLIILGQLVRDIKLFLIAPYYQISGNMIYYRWIAINLFPEWICGTKTKNNFITQSSLGLIDRLTTITMIFDWINIEDTKKFAFRSHGSIFDGYRGISDLKTFYLDVFMIWSTALFDDLARIISYFFGFSLNEKSLSLRLDLTENDLANYLRLEKGKNCTVNNIHEVISIFNNYILFIYKYRNIIAHKHSSKKSGLSIHSSNRQKTFDSNEMILIDQENIVKHLETFCRKEKDKINDWGFIIFNKKKLDALIEPRLFVIPLFKKILELCYSIFKIIFPNLNYSEFYKESLNKKKLIDDFFFPFHKEFDLKRLTESN